MGDCVALFPEEELFAQDPGLGLGWGEWYQFEHFSLEVLVKVIWSAQSSFEENGIIHICH